MIKKCIKCGVLKNVTSEFFYRESRAKDGFTATCKQCTVEFRSTSEYKEKAKKHRQTESFLEKNRVRCKKYYNNPTKRKRILERNRKWYSTHVRDAGKLYLQTAKYQRENKEKVSCHSALYNSVRLGKILKPDICSNCGNGGRICAHHHDYSKPFDVVWLCSKCHTNLHKNNLEKMV